MVPSARSSGARELPRSFSRSFSNIATSASSQHCLDRLLHLTGTERQAADEVEPCRVDEKLGADQLAQLAEIDLRDPHPLLRADDFTGVAGKRGPGGQGSARDLAGP